MNGTDRVIRWLAPAAPIVLVNVVAFSGQLAFLREHLAWPLIDQVAVALALESVAVYLAWQAHLAQLANDSSLRLRLAAYGWALLIGAMNYSHFAGPGWRPTFAAVAVALCSVASPWLWGIHTRRTSRDALMAAGLVEPHAVRLGGTRWVWHPYRSARVMWSATWEGETDPGKAIHALYPFAGGAGSRTVSSPVFTDAQSAALAVYKRTRDAGNPLSQNKLAAQFRLSRAEARDVIERGDSNGEGQQDGDPGWQRQGRQADEDPGRGSDRRQGRQGQVAAYERGRGDSLTSGPGSAPATQRGRDGTPHGSPQAVPAAEVPAGGTARSLAGASPNGVAHG